MFRYCLIIICIAFLTSCEGAKDLAPGVPVGSYKVQKLEGGEVELKELFGKVTLVTFMASWCESCKSGFSDLNQIHKLMAEKGGLVLGVALDDSISSLVKLKQEHNLDFPIYFDSEAKARKVFKITGFPESVVLDSKGAPKFLFDVNDGPAIKFIGARPWGQPRFADQILKMF